MKRYLKAYLSRDQMIREKDALIRKHKALKDLKYGDDFVQTKEAYIKFHVFQITFPLADLAGYDKVECDEIIKKFKAIAATLEDLSTELTPETQPLPPKASDNKDESLKTPTKPATK